MLVVIFGAGASYDSSPTYRPKRDRAEAFRPPLASELFENRELFTAAMTRFRDCVPLIPRLRNLGSGVSVEEVLERLYNEATDYPARHRQFSAIRFYLHYMIWECERSWQERIAGITNYVTLIDTIDRWRAADQGVCLITFNYDTLLEHGLNYHRIQIQQIQDYILHPYFKVIKVHGSRNWARQVRTAIADIQNKNTWQVGMELIEHADRLELSDTFRCVNGYPIGRGEGDTVATFPALAIPLTTKSAFECPQEHEAVLRECIPTASKVLVIGWRGAEKYFLDLFQKLLSPTADLPGLVVSGTKEAGEEVVRSIRPAMPRIQWEAFDGGFSEFVTGSEVDRFLGL